MKERTIYRGAWLTDIDDTLIASGESPDDEWIDKLSAFLKVLKEKDILWIPMSGVAMVKLGPRILFRIPEEYLSHVWYYGGDGSLRYYWNSGAGKWMEDDDFSRLFSDSQALMILGEDEFLSSFRQIHSIDEELTSDPETRLKEARKEVFSRGYGTAVPVLDILKKELERNGHDPDKSETYFRGGSVSWMMLGDIEAEPYQRPENMDLRKMLIKMGEEWLAENDGLESLGKTGITIPFPGARGIKFVLKGNSKERAAVDLLNRIKVTPSEIIFAGNELFQGGNDNMIRNIPGVTLLSVGEREDPGPDVISGLRRRGDTVLSGVESNSFWMDYAAEQLDKGKPWKEILEMMRREQ